MQKNGIKKNLQNTIFHLISWIESLLTPKKKFYIWVKSEGRREWKIVWLLNYKWTSLSKEKNIAAT